MSREAGSDSQARGTSEQESPSSETAAPASGASASGAPAFGRPAAGAIAVALLLATAALRVAIPDRAHGLGLEMLVTCLAPAALLTLLAWRAWTAGQFVLPAPAWTIPFGLVVLYTSLASRWAAEPFAGERAVLHRLSELGFLGLALLAAQAGENRRRQVTAGLLALGGALALYAVTERTWIQPATLEAFDREQLIERVDPEDRPALLSRLNSPRATGSFALANSLAALFVVLLPFAAWQLSRRHAARAIPALLLALFTLGLVATRSKGGALVALAVAAATFAFARSLSRARLLGLALAAVGGILVLASIPSVRDAAWPSVEVRLGYYGVALEAWLESPLVGHGPGGYQDAFFRLKDPGVEEARHAHSAYLEVAVELGLVGLGLLLFAWLPPLVRSLGRHPPTTPPQDSAPRTPWILPGAAVAAGLSLGILAGALPAAPESSWSVPFHLGLLTAAVVLTGMAARVTVPRLALALGGLGLLAHAAIDIDLQVPGLAGLGVVIVGLAAPDSRSIVRPLGRNLAALATLGFALLAFLLLRGVAIPEFRADLGRAEFLEAPLKSREELLARLEATAAASVHSPNDPALHLRLAHLSADLASTDPKVRTTALAHMEEAVRLDPEDAALALAHARLLLELMPRHPRALRELRRAVELYPAHPRARLLLADSLWERERREEAVDHYIRALAASEQLYERNRPRLGLTPAERARAEARRSP